MSTNFTLHTTVNDPLTIQQFQALLENLIPTDAITGSALTVIEGKIALADDSVGTSKLQENAVTSFELDDNAVTTGNLQAGSVTTAKIQNDAVTTDKVADGAITRDKLAANAMGVKSIQKGTTTANFTSRNIAINSVNANKSFVILNGGGEQGLGGEGGFVQFNPWVGGLSSTNLNIRLEVAGSGAISWQVIEFY